MAEDLLNMEEALSLASQNPALGQMPVIPAHGQGRKTVRNSSLPDLPEPLSQTENRKAETKDMVIYIYLTRGDHLQRTSASQPNIQTPNEYTGIEIAFIGSWTTLAVGCGLVGAYPK